MIENPLSLAAASLVVLLACVPMALALRRRESVAIPIIFSLCALASLMGALAGIWCVSTGAIGRMVLTLGVPDLPFHMRMDPLSGFFTTLLGLSGFFISIYSIGYVKGLLSGGKVTRMLVFYSLFLAGMQMVVLADDAIFFLVAWETMAAASYFLVLFDDERAENRKAALLYLVMAHVGAVTILLSFGVMAGLSTGFESFSAFTFDAMRGAKFTGSWAAVAFFLAFIGFGAKAGAIPLHVWLPEAHPVAPSNVSALMSGVMLKTAIYGLVRVTFDLLRDYPWWWGSIVLSVGLLTALLGIIYALMQNDLKRLLAYSSVENVGIILVCVGLSMVFHSFGLPLMSALALVAGLLHCLNHAMFKSLLFMGAGAVLHATHERNMEKMGGLIHHMPWTSTLFLVGCVSISALPPFNGFVSEWLTFQAFLLSPNIPNQLIKILMPLGAALLALTAALAAATFVKAFGVPFLGHWRSSHKPQIHEVAWSMRLAMIMAAAACLAIGLLPTYFIGWLDVITSEYMGVTLGASSSAWGWLWLTPIAPERASYSPFIVFTVGLGIYAIVYLVLHMNPGKLHRGPIWDCGFEKLTSRMQYTGTSFAMPLRRVFDFLLMTKETVRLAPQRAHAAFPVRISYKLKIRDWFWYRLYEPIVAASFWISRNVGRLQQGRIQTYLIYSFLTIVVLLFIKSL